MSGKFVRAIKYAAVAAVACAGVSLGAGFAEATDWPFNTCDSHDYYDGNGNKWLYSHHQFDNTNNHWKNYYRTYWSNGEIRENGWASCYHL